MRGGHIKVKKGTRHLFYMTIPCHSIESVVGKAVRKNEPLLMDQ